MNLEHLSVPLAGEKPVGEECESEVQSQNFGLMTEYLVERTLQKGRERAAEDRALDEAEARNAAASRDDGKRRLTSLESILKDVLKASTINVDQISKVLHDKSAALLANRGKDLRVLPHLCAAVTYSGGLEGYAACLELADSLLRSYPTDLYPLPDDEGPSGVWERANAISEMLSGTSIRVVLSPVVVLDAKQSGRLTFADLVGGLVDEMPASQFAQSDIDMAISEVGPEALQSVLGTFADIEARVAALTAAFDARTLPTPRLAEKFKAATAKLGGSQTGDLSAPGDSGKERTSAFVTKSNGVAALADMQSREDARRLIQEVIRYMERVEPSHPAPLLLKRADRLMGLSFFDIIKDMAPNAVSDIQLIAGAEPSQ